MTRLEWLVNPAKDASASSVKSAIEKLTWLRNVDAHQLDLSVLPNERRRFLAQVARRSTNQGLERRAERKYPILLAFVAQAAVDQLDEVVASTTLPHAVDAEEYRGRAPRLDRLPGSGSRAAPTQPVEPYARRNARTPAAVSGSASSCGSGLTPQ
jgi:hypothetical protein